ncbi:hypothetical protein L7F22_058978 [Adiantum nelumboides]|nr:hypothetical protein [Adiantum nelumboides]
MMKRRLELESVAAYDDNEGVWRVGGVGSRAQAGQAYHVWGRRAASRSEESEDVRVLQGEAKEERLRWMQRVSGQGARREGAHGALVVGWPKYERESIAAMLGREREKEELAAGSGWS